MVINVVKGDLVRDWEKSKTRKREEEERKKGGRGALYVLFFSVTSKSADRLKFNLIPLVIFNRRHTLFARIHASLLHPCPTFDTTNPFMRHTTAFFFLITSQQQPLFTYLLTKLLLL